MKKQQATLCVIALTVFALIAVGCGSSEPKSSPSDVWKANVTAWKKGDVEGYKKTLSKQALNTLTAMARQRGIIHVEDFLKGVMQNDPGKDTLETRNEKINGDTATLEVKNTEGRWNEEHFVKEDGEWKYGN